jgi:hypothetical protein
MWMGNVLGNFAQEHGHLVQSKFLTEAIRSRQSSDSECAKGANDDVEVFWKW